MRRLFSILILLGALAFLAFVWPTRWRYDHITVDKDTYLLRVERLTGHADILVPEMGWTPAEEPWDEDKGPTDGEKTSTVPA